MALLNEWAAQHSRHFAFSLEKAQLVQQMAVLERSDNQGSWNRDTQELTGAGQLVYRGTLPPDHRPSFQSLGVQHM